MYVPPQFREDDPAELQAIMRAAPFATMISNGPDGLVASHVPMMFDAQVGEHGTLLCHLAKANAHWRIAAEREALVIFNGPDAYISPNWYPLKAETGKVVPTWNYVAVHAYGVPRLMTDSADLRALVAQLTDVHEAGLPAPWSVDDAPDEFIENQLRGIVGLAIPLTRVIGKKKLSQNRTAADRAGVVAGLMRENLE